MTEMELNDCLRTIAGLNSNQSPEVVLAEFEVTSTELHNIANGKCVTMNDEAFALRFLLKDSFKSGKSNFVINKYIIQVIAHGKKTFLKTEEIATKVKVVKTQSKKPEKKEKEKLEFEVENNEQETLF